MLRGRPGQASTLPASRPVAERGGRLGRDLALLGGGYAGRTLAYLGVTLLTA